MNKNYVVSFPASGNHLTRFFIELLSERPTKGTGNIKDVELYNNTYLEDIPFNIEKGSTDYIFYKCHSPINNVNKLIFLVRNPKEVITKNSEYKFLPDYYDSYFRLLDYFNNYKGDKILFFYEDILLNKKNFVKRLYSFLDIKKENKLEYCLQHVEKLFYLSANGDNRAWGGQNSNGELNLYWDKCSDELKSKMEIFLNNKKQTNLYNELFNYYNI